MPSPSINCGKRKLVCEDRLLQTHSRIRRRRKEKQLKSEQSPYGWIPPAADNRYWAASASRSVKGTRLEIKLQNCPALVFAFLCWCNVADWPSLALNMMLSVLRIFLNQHWRVAARKVEVAVSQSCFCRKGDCLKGGGAVWPFHFSNLYLFAKTVSFFVSTLLFKTNLILRAFFFISLTMLPFGSLTLTSDVRAISK